MVLTSLPKGFRGGFFCHKKILLLKNLLLQNLLAGTVLLFHKRAIDSFVCPDRIRGKISTKLKNDYKISIGTAIPLKCSKCYLLLLCSENPYFISIDVTKTFFSKGKTQIKKVKTCGPPLLLGVEKIQGGLDLCHCV